MSFSAEDTGPVASVGDVSPGVSMILNRYDFPLVSGKTTVTGVLLMPTPL